jgi:hypothetical protein
MSSRVITTSYGCAALDALRAVVADVKRDDPMGPCHTVSPNNIADSFHTSLWRVQSVDQPPTVLIA